MRKLHDICIYNINTLEIPSCLKYKIVDDSTITLEIYEDDKNWFIIEKLLTKYRKNYNIISAEFSKQELLNAKYLRMCSNVCREYPEPSGCHLLWIAATYDINDFCDVCYQGYRQKYSFRCNKPSTIKDNVVFNLNWVPDSFFTTMKTWRNIFKSYNIDYWPVLNKTGDIIEDLVQLKIDRTIDDNLQLVNYDFDKCLSCGRNIYKFINDGYFPSCKSTLSFSGARHTREFFGQGAFRETIISSDLYRTILDNNIKGLLFTPLIENDTSDI